MVRFVGLGLAAAALSASPVVAASCGELWYSRNAIYKSAGYCFKTSRAIEAFGNAGCTYDDMRDVPLSGGQRRAVAEIVRAERDGGCTP